MAITQSLSFGILLKRHRLAAGLTQEEIAERARLSVRGISDLEHGVRRSPHRTTIHLLADALGLSADDRAKLEFAAGRRPAGFRLRPVGFGLSSSPVFPPREAHPEIARADSSPALVGRTAELETIEEHLLGVGPPLLLFAGEPGIGKSRLLQEAGRHGTLAGMTVLHGGCQRRSGQESYAPLLEALADHIDRQSPAHLRALLHGAAWLVRLLPELHEMVHVPLPMGSLDPEHERRLMFGAITRFLQNAAGPTGVLLLLDDLQWAGSDALDLLATLVRNAARVPLRVVGAYRDIEVTPPHPLLVTLADLAQAGLARQRPLAPLAVEEAQQLLEDLLIGAESIGPEVQERLLRRAGGLPFFLITCVEGLRTEAPRAHPGSGEAVPWNVAQGIRQRIASLPEAAREMLRTAAVIGRVIPQSMLIGVSELPARAVLIALDAACQTRLLAEEAPHSYRFAHDVIREVIEADLGMAHRTLLHQRIAETLEQRPGGERRAAELAWHFCQGDDWERGLKYSLLAGDRAASRFAYDEADQHFRRGAELAGAAEPSKRAEALEKGGLVLRALARYEEALLQFEEAARLRRGGLQAGGEAFLVSHIGQVLGDLGKPREGIARIQGFLASSPGNERARTPDDPVRLAFLHVTLAGLFWATGQFREQLAAAERAADLARLQDDERTLLRAEVRRGQALRSLGRYREAQQVLESAIPTIEAAGYLELLAPALDSLSIVCLAAGDFRHEALHLQRAFEAANQVGDPALIAFITSKLGQNAYYLGEWDRARQYLDQAISIVRTLGAVWFAPYALGALGATCLARGEWEEAAKYLEESITIGVDAGFQALENSQSLMAVLEITQGRPAAALARLQHFIGGTSREPSSSVGPLWVLAWSHLEQGNEQEASAIVTPGLKQARTQNDQLGLVHLLWIQAMIAAGESRWQEAEGALDEVLATTRRMPYPYHEARALETYGSIQVRQGDTASAFQTLTKALAIFQDLGAQPCIEQVERMLLGLERT